MNRVELQNGCLSRGHSNTFLPSTIAGTSLNPSTRKLSKEKVKENLLLAIDAYISRVDGCPCGNTTIKLYKGPDSTIRQRMRSKLTVFLKGSNKKKELRSSDPELFQYFSEVWSIRNSHMVYGLPSQYVFYLVCCYDKECLHPLCKLGHTPVTPTWYPGGLMLTHLYLWLILSILGDLHAIGAKVSVLDTTSQRLWILVMLQLQRKYLNHLLQSKRNV